jgi:hypothetical protein
MHMVWHKLDIHGQAPEKLRRIPGRFEMRVARPHFRFSTVENRVTSTLHRCERKRIVSKLLAPSNYRSPTLSETVRRCGHSPITVSQRSRICHINFHAHACKTSEGPKANRKQTAHAVAPSLSHTLADSARQPVQPLHRFSMVQNLSHRPPMPQHGCKHRCVTGYRRSANCSRRRAIALPHSRRLCAPAGAAPSPFLNGPKSVPSSARINVCASVGVAGYRRSANCSRRRAIPLSHSRRLCAPAGAAPSPFLDGPKSVPSSARINVCASVGVAGYRRSAKCPRRRAIALPHSRRLSAPAGAAPSPFLNGPKSVPSSAHENVDAKHRCVTGYRRSPNCSRRRAIALPHSRRLCASRCSPFTVSQWSKVRPIVRPHQRVCKRRCGRIPKVGKMPAPSCHCSESDYKCAPVRVASSQVDPPATFADRALAPSHTKGSETKGQKIACAIAVALPGTLADCARQPAHSRYRLSMVEICPFNRPRQHVCKHW